MNGYKQERYNRILRFSRMFLGCQQLVNRPILNFIWIPFGIAIFLLINAEAKYIEFHQGALISKNIMENVFRAINIIVPIIFVIGIIEFIGECTARKDECDMTLVFGNRRDIINQPPILIMKKYDKRRKITSREFYTSISMENWRERQEAICDRLNVHMLGDISYGGRNKDKGNRIKFKTKKGRRVVEREKLYDDTFS